MLAEMDENEIKNHVFMNINELICEGDNYYAMKE